MKTIKDYHDLYLKCDVLLLADVFEKFKNSSLKRSELCLSHYLGTLALRWDAMLNMPKVEWRLGEYPDMYLFSVKSKRGREFLAFLRDIIKPTVSIWNLMIQNKNQSILFA